MQSDIGTESGVKEVSTHFAGVKLYRYIWCQKVWGTLKGPNLRGRICVIVQRFRMNSAAVRFLDTGEIQIISRNALRRCG